MRNLLLAVLILAVPMATIHAQEEEDDQPAPEIPAVISDPAIFEAQVIETGGRVDFAFGDDRAFEQCHASTIAQAHDGSLVCAWFGGTKEKDPDVGIWYARFHDDKWTPPAKLAKVNETAHWNPVLFHPEGGKTLYAFFKVGPEIPDWQTYWMSSDDCGRTWSDATELVPGDDGGRGPVKNKPIVLSDGAWLAGASTEKDGWRPFADRSENQGATWRRSDNFDLSAIPGRGAIQPTLWESKPGYVHALMRTSMGKVVRAGSDNGGITWTPVYETGLPNNNSGVDLVQLDDGALYLVLNPVGENWGPRTPLTLARSTDNGHTWTYQAHLENQQGEYSYPAIIKTNNGLALSYTYRRDRVRVWQIPTEALPE